jgi:hypothetical protein
MVGCQLYSGITMG